MLKSKKNIRKSSQTTTPMSLAVKTMSIKLGPELGGVTIMGSVSPSWSAFLGFFLSNPSLSRQRKRPGLRFRYGDTTYHSSIKMCCQINFSVTMQLAVSIRRSASHPMIVHCINGSNSSWILSSSETPSSHIASKLTEAGFHSLSKDCIDVIGNPLLGQLCSEARTALDLAEKTKSSSWIISHNSAIRGSRSQKTDEGQEDGWVCVEVRSPTFPASDLCIRLVKDAYSVLRSIYRIEVNKTHGLRVRVGNGSNGFDFIAQKKFLLALWTFEEQLADLIPTHRRTATQSCSAWRKHSALAVGMNHHGFERNFASKGLITILGMKKPVEILEAQGYKALAFEFKPVNAASWNNENRIIEFRQHEATLDFERISTWIGFCTELVTNLYKLRFEAIKRWTCSDISKGVDECSFEQIMLVLGMKAYNRFYANRLLEARARRLDWAACKAEVIEALVEKKKIGQEGELTVQK